MKNKKTRSYNSIVRQKQAEETKNRIADAAEELIKGSGYENTTIGAIAKKAGVATQTVYAIFNSKQGILIYLLKRSFGATKLELNFSDLIKQDSMSKIAQMIAETTTKHGQKQISTMNSLGGFELLYPELHSLVDESSKSRHQSIEEGIREALKHRCVDMSEAKMKMLIDIIWAFTDNHFYYCLVVDVGWPLDKYQILFHKIMEMVLQDLAPEMLDALGE